MSGVRGRDWSCDLPRDILELILSNIRLVNDIKQFGTVCKQWHIAAIDYTKNQICFGTQWLVKKKLMEFDITLYHPLAENSFHTSIEIPLMNGASILCSKDGWLLMNKGCEVFFLSPFSKYIIKLPNLPHCGVTFTGFTITSAPTSNGWQICGLRPYENPKLLSQKKFGIFTIGYGEKNWKRTLGTVPIGCFVAHETNPAYHKGKFYFLCTNGALGVLDPNIFSWKILAFKKPENGSKPYLLECDGELFAILNWSMDNVKVVKLDELRMIWNEVNDIGEYTFFLSKKTSYAKKSIKGYMRNKLFSPNLNGNYGVFYCFKNRSYQTFGNNLSCNELTTTTLVLECCWIEPTNHDISSLDESFKILSVDKCTSSTVSNTCDGENNDGSEDEDGDIDYRITSEDEECLHVFERAWSRTG